MQKRIIKSAKAQNHPLKKSAKVQNHPIKNEKNPKNFSKSINVVGDCISDSFCVFKSINNIFHLIYQNNKYNIVSYDLINSQVITQIKSNSNQKWYSFR